MAQQQKSARQQCHDKYQREPADIDEGRQSSGNDDTEQAAGFANCTQPRAQAACLGECGPPALKGNGGEAEAEVHHHQAAQKPEEGLRAGKVERMEQCDEAHQQQR
jgi:hypothetical protein